MPPEKLSVLLVRARRMHPRADLPAPGPRLLKQLTSSGSGRQSALDSTMIAEKSEMCWRRRPDPMPREGLHRQSHPQTHRRPWSTEKKVQSGLRFPGTFETASPIDRVYMEPILPQACRIELATRRIRVQWCPWTCGVTKRASFTSSRDTKWEPCHVI